MLPHNVRDNRAAGTTFKQDVADTIGETEPLSPSETARFRGFVFIALLSCTF